MKTSLLFFLLFFIPLSIFGQPLSPYDSVDGLVLLRDRINYLINNQEYKEALNQCNLAIESKVFRKQKKKKLSQKKVKVLANFYYLKSLSNGYLGKHQQKLDLLNSLEKDYPNLDLKYYYAELKRIFMDDRQDIDSIFDLINNGKKSINLGQILFNMGYFDKASSFYRASLFHGERESLKTDEGFFRLSNEVLMYYLGRITQTVGNEKEANHYFELGLSSIKNSDRLVCCSEKAFSSILLHELKRDKEALQLLNSLLINNPDDICSLKYRGKILMDSKEYETAVNDFVKIFSKNPYEKDVVKNLILCYYYLGKEKQALNTVKGILKIFPYYYDAYCLKATLLLSNENYDLALENIETAIKLKPKHPWAYKIKGDVERTLNNTNNACQQYQLAEERYYSTFYKDNQVKKYINEGCPN